MSIKLGVKLGGVLVTVFLWFICWKQVRPAWLLVEAVGREDSEKLSKAMNEMVWYSLEKRR